MSGIMSSDINNGLGATWAICGGSWLCMESTSVSGSFREVASIPLAWVFYEVSLWWLLRFKVGG